MNTSDFLSFAKDIEREQATVNVSQEINGNLVIYAFDLICRLETQQTVIFKISKNNLDYELNSKQSLTFSIGEDQITITPDSFVFDRFHIIVKYSTVKITSKDTKVDESDSRRNTRFKIKREFKAKVELSSLRISEKIVTILIDLSQTGAALMLQGKHADPLQVGDIVNLNKIAGEKIEMLEGTVVHKRLIDENKNHYQVALNFVSPLKMTKVLALVKLCKIND